jgi:hypothetical protein
MGRNRIPQYVYSIMFWLFRSPPSDGAHGALSRRNVTSPVWKGFPRIHKARKEVCARYREGGRGRCGGREFSCLEDPLSHGVHDRRVPAAPSEQSGGMARPPLGYVEEVMLLKILRQRSAEDAFLECKVEGAKNSTDAALRKAAPTTSCRTLLGLGLGYESI